MGEWLKPAVLKTVSGVTRSGVRIPLPPPYTKEPAVLARGPATTLCSPYAFRRREAIDEARTGGPAGRHGLALAERRGASRRKLGASAALIMLGDRDGRQRRIAVDTGSVRQGRVRPA